MIDQLASQAHTAETSWRTLIPADLRPASGDIQLASLTHLSLSFGFGGENWMRQFLFGFKLIGNLSQVHCFPRNDKDARKLPAKMSRIMDSSRSCFPHRSSRSGYKNSGPLWNEAIDQVEKCWLLPPPLTYGGKPVIPKHAEMNIAPRVGLDQGAKMRDCDDPRHSRTNLACVVEPPIKLSRCGHVVELPNLVNRGDRDRHFSKADYEEAYKQLPLEWGHAKLSAIAIRDPVDKRWYGFLSRTLVFGAVSAVLHYNVSPRILSEISTKIFGIPLRCYFDDFGDIAPASLSETALQTFTLFCPKLGIQLNIAKAEVGRRIIFLGVDADFPCFDNGDKLAVSLPREKYPNLATPISGFLQEGLISSQELEKMIGNLGFGQTNLFGRFARTQLMPTYRKFYAETYVAELSDSERRILHGGWESSDLSDLVAPAALCLVLTSSSIQTKIPFLIELRA